MRILLVALTALTLAACASAGTRVDPAKVAKFQRGITTANQVQASLGPANGTSTLADGGVVLVYTYSHYQTRPETFIPYVGMFVGGADASTQTVSFTFGPDSRLSGSSSTQSATGVGMGLSAR